jgi:hypothetical protein
MSGLARVIHPLADHTSARQHPAMATFLSSPAAVGARATPGERRFADRLADLLEDDYLCWYDVPVGPKYQHPDFMVLHPRRGLLVLEVKDWRLDTIRDLTPVSATLDLGSGLKTVANPLEQARQYAQAVVRILQSDPLLVNPEGHQYMGGLKFPYGYGVVLTHITRQQFEKSGMGDVLPAHRVICRDEMTESADAEEFQQRLSQMFSVQFQSLLTLPEIERIRWLLFPEIRIHQQGLALAEVTDGPAPAPDALKVMDLAQEAIARGQGEGHRVIHGVAGSGKTLILAYRCQFLARTLTKPILVLVFNKALAAWLQFQIASHGLSEKVSVRHFHGWCMDQLRHYQVPSPPQGPDFVANLVDAVIRGVDRSQIPRAQYGAVLIDEGHDFEPNWLRLVVQMLDPESNSLLLLYDDAQSIYQSKTERFTFRSVGISAVGRTKILKRNYRNTDEILACASAFARELLQEVNADEDSVPLVMPEPGGRKGPKPVFRELRNVQEEADCIAHEILQRRKAGTAPSDMGVFYPAQYVGTAVAEALARADIPFEWLKDAKSKQWQPGHDSVKLMTMHSSKGLRYRVGIIAGAGCLPYLSKDDDARLMYVAMTRATHELLITGSKRSEFTDRLKEICRTQAA